MVSIELYTVFVLIQVRPCFKILIFMYAQNGTSDQKSIMFIYLFLFIYLLSFI